MLRRFAILATMFSSTAIAQSYLPQTDSATAIARSQTLCTQQPHPCTGGTKYWLPVQTHTDGTASIVIPPSGPWNNNLSNTTGLTAGEISAIQTETQMGTKLPWILGTPAFKARFTAGQLAAMGNSSDQTVSTGWTAVNSAATVNLHSATIINMVNAALADGIISAANAQTILAPIAVAQAVMN